MNKESNILQSEFGEYSLERLPVQKHQPLRAWDAADEYLLQHLRDDDLAYNKKRLLIINDAFGALTVSLHRYQPSNWSDSLLSHQACGHNLQQNGIDGEFEFVRSTDTPKGFFDIVLIKIPKTLGLLEDFLIRLKPHIHADTHIISAGMIKHLPKAALLLLEKILGPTTTSLAKKKARVAFTRYEKSAELVESPYPRCYFEPTTLLSLCSHANVFSKDKLDIGSRFLLEQLKALPQKKSIVDLGCGNGVLGLMAQRQQLDAKVSFVDESYMAIASAKRNYERAFPTRSAAFVTSDCLNELSGEVDLVLCNPPFHQQHSVGDFIAWQMFTQSQQKLSKGGELWVVGNRHMNYHVKLKKLFGETKRVAANQKFVVLRAIKR